MEAPKLLSEGSPSYSRHSNTACFPAPNKTSSVDLGSWTLVIPVVFSQKKHRQITTLVTTHNEPACSTPSALACPVLPCCCSSLAQDQHPVGGARECLGQRREPQPMGSLGAKLRSKFPRRQSGGILSLSSAKSNQSSKSISSSKSDNGLEAEDRECTANGVSVGIEDIQEVAAETATDAPACCPPATDRSGRELCETGALRHVANEQGDRDRRTPTDVTSSNAGKSIRFATSNPGDNLGVLADGKKRPESPKIATNGPLNPDPANATLNSSNKEPPQPAPPSPQARSMAPSSDGQQHDLHGADRRFSTASRSLTLSSIDEIAAADADGNRDRDRDSDNNDTPALRRIHLQDPPVNNSLDSPQLRSSNSVSNSPARPTAPPRRQSLLPSRQTTLIRTLLSAAQADELDPSVVEHLLPISATMVTRKIWVKKPGGSPTLVTINEEDLVDDVRDMILRKYSNSLGRQFDAPDLILKIVPREQQRQDRILEPQEPMARTLDAYFPGGQTVEEALVIDIPQRRVTPRASPRSGPPHAQHLTSVYEAFRPAEAGTDYFGPEAVAHVPVSVAGPHMNGPAQLPHSMSIISTGQAPQIPSPGGTRGKNYRERPERPRLGRQHTSSPTILNVIGAGGHATTIAVAPNTTTAAAAAAIPAIAPVGSSAGSAATAHGSQRSDSIDLGSRTHLEISEQTNGGQVISAPTSAPPTAPGMTAAASAQPLPTTPASEVVPVSAARVGTPPPPRAASPRLSGVAKAKKKKTDVPALPAGMLSGGVPPINVLIVEDNIINLRLLEAFIKRLKVRWATAMNGREAVTKWRNGGFHLVLMDIQLPIMNGLDATREIRRLERINSIGAFSATPAKGSASGKGNSKIFDREQTEDDILLNRERFKSPVIIVALTASSLQSDRHEALAAGCNDFLTKVSKRPIHNARELGLN